MPTYRITQCDSAKDAVTIEADTLEEAVEYAQRVMLEELAQEKRRLHDVERAHGVLYSVPI